LSPQGQTLPQQHLAGLAELTFRDRTHDSPQQISPRNTTGLQAEAVFSSLVAA
jgi:hypothetical protein